MYVFALTVLLFLGERGKDWRLGEAGELSQILEVLEDRFQEFSVVLGRGVGLGVVVTMVVVGGSRRAVRRRRDGRSRIFRACVLGGASSGGTEGSRAPECAGGA